MPSVLHWTPTNKVALISLGADHELLVQREGEVGPVARQRTPPRVCHAGAGGAHHRGASRGEESVHLRCHRPPEGMRAPARIRVEARLLAGAAAGARHGAAALCVVAAALPEGLSTAAAADEPSEASRLCCCCDVLRSPGSVCCGVLLLISSDSDASEHLSVSVGRENGRDALAASHARVALTKTQPRDVASARAFALGSPVRRRTSDASP